MQNSLLQSVSVLCDEGRYADIAETLSARFGLSSESHSHIASFLASPKQGRHELSPLLDGVKFSTSDVHLLQVRFAEKRPSVFGNEIDYIGASVPESLATAIIYVANRRIPKIGTAAVVTSVRNEGPWILEWIAHYKALGIGLIVVVHNDSDDGTGQMLDHLATRGEIIAIRNEVAGTVSPQRKAFNAVLHLLPDVHGYEWISFLDADEFLVPLSSPEATIADIINEIAIRAKRQTAEQIDAILLHWRWFASPLQYNWRAGPTTTRFTFSAENEHVKSIARTSNVWSMSRLHVPTLVRSGFAVDSGGCAVNLAEQLNPPRYEVAQINHYFAKSFQEFALKKLRGRGAIGLEGPTREFDNFLWGAHQLASEVRDFSSTERVLRALLDDQFLLRLNRDSEDNSRRKIERLEKEFDLRRLHAEITRYVKQVAADESG